MKRALFVLLFNLIGIASYCQAFEVSTHRKLNEAATNSSTLNDYLRSNLGFSDGANQIIARHKVIDWIKDGGEFEDQGNFFHTGGRYYSHFHNPLMPWSQAGLNITYQGVTFFNESSLLWAQEPAGTQQYYGNYSWHDAREYYYKALTSPDSTDRDQAFADSFRAVGQVMHLVEDASVPAHTRNDAHILYNFEKWVKDNENSLNTIPIFPTVPLSVSINRYVPISQFWDTNQYDGSFPLTGTDIGIAEYSNANFLSEDTIFSSEFPYPDKSLTELWTDQSNNRKYLRSIGRGEPVQHQAAVSALYWYRLNYFPQYSSFFPLGLDDKSYEEQANYLVPRAIGYSAGVKDYFFRGKMDAQKDGEGGIKITNNSEEAMSGNFEMYYDAVDGNRHPVEGGTWTLALAANETSARQTFTPPTDSQAQGKFMLVFRGQLGAERDAVAGKVIEIEPSYLFIIQETTEILDPPYTFTTLNDKYWVWRASDNPDPNISGYYPRQRISGKFVLHGAAYIQKIRLASFYGIPKVYLNGALINQDTWTGSPVNIPTTWAIETDHQIPPSTPGVGVNFIVQLSNGELFEAPLVAVSDIRFHVLSHVLDQNRQEIEKADGNLGLIGPFSPLGTPSLIAGQYGHSNYQPHLYLLQSIAGYPVDQEQLNAQGPDLPGYYYEPPLPPNVPAQPPYRLFTLSSVSVTLGGNSNFNPEQDMPVQAEVKYTMLPDEADRLRGLGLTPIDFTVTLKGGS